MSPSRRRTQGFTLLEVMIAMMVMVIGLMGIVGLQLHTIRMNNESRQFTQALTIAENWSNRLKLDALNWTAIVPQGTAPGATVGASRYLANLDGPGALVEALTFQTAAQRSGLIFNQANSYHFDRFDFQGRDMASGAATTGTVFCVSTRLGWIYYGTTMRADVRVYWPKKIPDATAVAQDVLQSQFSNFRVDCAVPSGAPEDLSRFHVVYLPNTLRVTTLDPP